MYMKYFSPKSSKSNDENSIFMILLSFIVYPTVHKLYYKNKGNSWVQVGSGDSTTQYGSWKSSHATITGSVTSKVLALSAPKMRLAERHMICSRRACHDTLSFRTKTSYSERISKRATPLVVWATAMASYRKREDIDDPHPFQRFWTKLISLRERSSWVRRTLVEFLKSHISKYIGFSMEIQKRHCHRNPAAPEFLLKVLCILKYMWF